MCIASTNFYYNLQIETYTLKQRSTFSNKLVTKYENKSDELNGLENSEMFSAYEYAEILIQL